MHPNTKNATGETKIAKNGISSNNSKQAPQMPLGFAVAIFIITLLILAPLVAIVDESDNLTNNLCGLAYLGILIALGHTRIGRMWNMLVRISSDRIFGKPKTSAY